MEQIASPGVSGEPRLGRPAVVSIRRLAPVLRGSPRGVSSAWVPKVHRGARRPWPVRCLPVRTHSFMLFPAGCSLPVSSLVRFCPASSLPVSQSVSCQVSRCQGLRMSVSQVTWSLEVRSILSGSIQSGASTCGGTFSPGLHPLRS